MQDNWMHKTDIYECQDNHAKISIIILCDFIVYFSFVASRWVTLSGLFGLVTGDLHKKKFKK